MSLSRHFYALDEVHSALQYSSTRNDRAETLFWCNELLRSGCVSETISTLLESWLWNKGPFCLSWILNSFSTLGGDECSEEDVLLSAYQLSCISYLKRDHSLWSILALHSLNVPCDRVGPKTIPHPFTDDREIYLVRAIVQGRAYSAWCMSQQMDWDRVRTILSWYSLTTSFTLFQTCLSFFEEYDKLLGYRTPEYDIVFRCLTVIMICLSPSQQEESFRPLPSCIDATSKSQIDRWDSLLGTKARVYSIPPSALYGRTLRGRMRWEQSTVSQLNNIEPHLLGCPFWEEAISEYGTILKSTILWNSDDDRESFYQRYFPDDIPDEWTKSEKNKSHGEGILGPTESLTMVKYVRMYLSKWSRFAWNSHTLIMKLLEGKEGTHPTAILLVAGLVEVPMIPIKRRLIV